MPFVPAVNTAKVLHEFVSNQNNHAMNITWVRDTTGAYTPTRLAELLTVLSQWYDEEWSNLAVDDWEIDRLVAQDWSEENGIVDQVLPSFIGVSVSPALPSTTTIALSLRTGLAGRSQRGRLYYVGLGENSALGDFIDGAAATAIIGGYMQMKTVLEAADFEWVVASFVTDGAPRVTAQLLPITDIIMTNIALDTMRSRHAN